MADWRTENNAVLMGLVAQLLVMDGPQKNVEAIRAGMLARLRADVPVHQISSILTMGSQMGFFGLDIDRQWRAL